MGHRTEKKLILFVFSDSSLLHLLLLTRYSKLLMGQIQTYTYSHINTHKLKHTHTNGLWAGSCSRRGGSDFGGWTRLCRALLWKYLWPPNTKSISFSSLFFCSLWQPDYLLHLSCLWPSPTLNPESLFLCLAERIKYVISWKTHLSCHLRKWRKRILCLASLLLNKFDSVFIACRCINSVMQRRPLQMQFSDIWEAV